VGPDRGGVAYSFSRAVEALRAEGWNVVVERPAEQPSAARSAVRSVIRRRRELRRADVVHVEFGSNDRVVFLFAVLAALARADVTLVAHDYPKPAHAPAAGLLRLDRRWRVILAHRVLSPLLDGLLIGALFRRAGAIAVFSEQAREGWRRRVPRTPAVAIPHGDIVPIPGAAPPSAGSSVLFAGYIGPSKGVDILVEAWQRIDGEHGLPLVIAGRSPATADAWTAPLRSRTERWNPPAQWVGHVESEREFQALFARAAIVVLPYRSSSPASGILVRAMMQGRAIVATAVPAVLNHVRDGVDGIIVAPGDVDALARALSQLLGDGPRRDELGAAAERRARAQFSWKAQAAGLASAYGYAHSRVRPASTTSRWVR